MSDQTKSATGRLVVFITIVIALFLAMRFLPVQQWLRSFNDWVGQMGTAGIFIFIGVYAVATVLMAPGSILTTGAGHVAFAVKPEAFVTIHSTDNTSRSADALHHALAMSKGLRSRHNRTGFLTWHFTVDDHSIYQSLPTNETGEHADYEGQGNRSSIGIEMCVNRGNNLGSTIDRTAQLTARLMRQYDIPLNHVVPHMHWRRIRYSDGRDEGFKKCPRILLDGGRLGPKWSAFMAKVSFYAR